jgi:hypothetical protein
MSGSRSRIRLVPTAELVCETAAVLPLPGLRVELSGGRNDPHPLVYVTPDRRVIAGQAYVKAWQESGRSAILCCVIADDDLGAALTRVHNRILFRQLGTDELCGHLQVYIELCLYWHSSSSVSALPSSGSAQTTDAEESRSSRSDPSDSLPPSAGDPGNDPWFGPPDGEDAVPEPDGSDLWRWRRLDHFWYP